MRLIEIIYAILALGLLWWSFFSKKTKLEDYHSTIICHDLPNNATI